MKRIFVTSLEPLRDLLMKKWISLGNQDHNASPQRHVTIPVFHYQNIKDRPVIGSIDLIYSISGTTVSACERQYQRRDLSVYTPRCQSDGAFDELQCAADECFCVDANGAMIPRTNVLLSNGRPNCTATQPGNPLFNVKNGFLSLPSILK